MLRTSSRGLQSPPGSRIPSACGEVPSSHRSKFSIPETLSIEPAAASPGHARDRAMPDFAGSGRSATVMEPETRDEKTSGLSGPRIRCPLCGWSPRKEDRWSCDCGCQWNTFDTGGVCPACLHQWTSTQCLSCVRWSAHSDWYAE